MRELSLEFRKIEWAVQVFGELSLNSLIGIRIAALDDDLLDLGYRRMLPCSPFIEISLPFGWIGDGIRQKVSRLAGCGFISKLDQFIDSLVVSDGKSFHVDADLGFCESQGMMLVLGDHDVDGAR